MAVQGYLSGSKSKTRGGACFGIINKQGKPLKGDPCLNEPSERTKNKFSQKCSGMMWAEKLVFVTT